MQNIKKDIAVLNNLIIEKRLVEGFDMFYGEEVSMQENENALRVGFAANRTAEAAFESGLTAWKAEVLSVAIGDDVSMVEWDLDFNHKDWGPQKKKQVSVAHWKDGKIVKEKFYYDTAKK